MNATMNSSFNWEEIQTVLVRTFTQYKWYLVTNAVTLLLCFVISRLLSSKEDLLLKTVKKEFKNIEKVKEKLKRDINILQNTTNLLFYLKIILILMILTMAGILVYNSYFTQLDMELIIENKYNVYLLLILTAVVVVVFLISAIINYFLNSKRNRFESLDGNQLVLAQHFLSGIGPELSKLLKEHFIAGERKRGLYMEYMMKKINTLELSDDIYQKETMSLKSILNQVVDFSWCEACFKSELQQKSSSGADEITNENANNGSKREENGPVRKYSNQEGRVISGSENCTQNCLQKYFELTREVGRLYNIKQQELAGQMDKCKRLKAEETQKLEEYQNCTLDNYSAGNAAAGRLQRAASETKKNK